MDSLLPTRTQVTVWLSYDHSSQEKEGLLASLDTQFGIREIDEIPVNDAHERILCFFTDGTDDRYEPLLEFLARQKQAGVCSDYELVAVEDEQLHRPYMLALTSPMPAQGIARWYNNLLGQHVTVPERGDSRKKQKFVVRDTYELLVIPHSPGRATALARVFLQSVPRETGGSHD